VSSEIAARRASDYSLFTIHYSLFTIHFLT